MAHFSTTLTNLRVVSKLVDEFSFSTNCFDHATTNDEHSKIYAYNARDDVMWCLEIDDETNTFLIKNSVTDVFQGMVKPRATRYGNLIYYHEKLFKFGGYYNTNWIITETNQFFEFNLKTWIWRQLKLQGKELPQQRYFHQFIKHKHRGILFGGITTHNISLYDLWVVDLNTFIWTKLFDSKMMKMDKIEWNGMSSAPQLVNENIIVYMVREKKHFYWIDLSENNFSHSDWNKGPILSNYWSFNHIVSNQDCIIVFDPLSFEFDEEFSMQLLINEDENENYSLNLSQNPSRLLTKCKKLINVTHKKLQLQASHNHSDFERVNSFWLNNTFIWIKYVTNVSKLPVVYCIDNMRREMTITNRYLKDTNCMPKFKVLNKIGTGATSIVYDAVMLLNKRGINSLLQRSFVGIKPNDKIVIKKENYIANTDGSSTSTIFNEYNILKKIHDNKYTSDITCKLFQHFVEHNIHHLVLSKCGLSLQHLHLHSNNNKFSLFQSLLILNQMLIILYKLHSIGIVHNDIKPENVLIDDPKNIANCKHLKLYLIDFGISKMFWDFERNRHIDKVTQTWDEKDDESIPFEGTFRFSSLQYD